MDSNVNLIEIRYAHLISSTSPNSVFDVGYLISRVRDNPLAVTLFTAKEKFVVFWATSKMRKFMVRFDTLCQGNPQRWDFRKNRGFLQCILKNLHGYVMRRRHSSSACQ